MNTCNKIAKMNKSPWIFELTTHTSGTVLYPLSYIDRIIMEGSFNGYEEILQIVYA